MKTTHKVYLFEVYEEFSRTLVYIDETYGIGSTELLEELDISLEDTIGNSFYMNYGKNSKLLIKRKKEIDFNIIRDEEGKYYFIGENFLVTPDDKKAHTRLLKLTNLYVDTKTKSTSEAFQEIINIINEALNNANGCPKRIDYLSCKERTYLAHIKNYTFEKNQTIADKLLKDCLSRTLCWKVALLLKKIGAAKKIKDSIYFNDGSGCFLMGTCAHIFNNVNKTFC